MRRWFVARGFVAFGLGLVSVMASGCADVASTEDDLTGTTYGDMASRLQGDELSRWEAARSHLVASFDQACGDTFCSGDYSNLTTVDLTCSITQSGYVKECRWLLAGSIEYVDGATGSFLTDARLFPCVVPVKAKAGLFLDALDEVSPDDAVKAALPVTGTSFYDGIASCLSGVVGKPPPPATGAAYQELADYFNEHPDPYFWFGVRRSLNDAFAASCGDTFCGDAWTRIEGLRFVCATTPAGAVKGCQWTFGAASPKVTTKGKVSGPSKVLTCPVAASGSAEAVAQALAGADPLSAVLPGAVETLAEQLGECLE